MEELSRAGNQCIACDNGQDAVLSWRQGRFDLVVLDWSLPDISGLEICRRLRRSGNTTPVLMLTARDDMDERIEALDEGVDDYLTKPFDLKELHARVRAQLRRAAYAHSPSSQTSTISLGDLLLDPINRRVQRGEREIDLSPKEFDLLFFLLRRTNEVHSRQSILDAVWGSPFIGDPNTLDVYMGYLRKKIEVQGEPQLLHTVRGIGFIARLANPKP